MRKTDPALALWHLVRKTSRNPNKRINFFRAMKTGKKDVSFPAVFSAVSSALKTVPGI